MKGTKVFFPVIILCSLLLFPGVSIGQEEGALHTAFRHLVAIPYALLGSLLGPGCDKPGRSCEFVYGPRPPLRQPSPGPYVAVVPYEEIDTGECEKGYVTYTLVYPKQGYEKKDCGIRAVTYDAPLPFDF